MKIRPCIGNPSEQVLYILYTLWTGDFTMSLPYCHKFFHTPSPVSWEVWQWAHSPMQYTWQTWRGSFFSAYIVITRVTTADKTLVNSRNLTYLFIFHINNWLMCFHSLSAVYTWDSGSSAVDVLLIKNVVVNDPFDSVWLRLTGKGLTSVCFIDSHSSRPDSRHWSSPLLLLNAVNISFCHWGQNTRHAVKV